MFESNNKITTQIDWTPLKRGGTVFATRKLVEVSPSRYEFKPPILVILFSLIFIMGPLHVVYFFIQTMSDKQNLFLNVTENSSGEKLIMFMRVAPLIIMLSLIVVGVRLLITHLRPVVFDKNVGFFWKSFRKPDSFYSGNKRKNTVRIKEIHGLQIVKELVQGKNSFTSYELNLVLNNSERINVIDHGNLQKVKKDAQKLAKFLRVPLWEATLQN